MTWTLQSVDDGGLQIAVKADEPKTYKSYTLEQKTLNRYGDYLEESYKRALSNLATLQKQLAEGIAGQQKFYFPASGTFFFKNPMMNHDGALICGIGYNGNDDFPNEAETTKRINVQPTPDAAQPEQRGAVEGGKNNPNPPKDDKDKSASK